MSIRLLSVENCVAGACLLIARATSQGLSLDACGKREEARKVARDLLGYRQPDGSVLRSKTSITCSGGNSLVVETTSLAVLVWLCFFGDGEFVMSMERSIEWLCKQCHGTFGSTQVRDC